MQSMQTAPFVHGECFCALRIIFGSPSYSRVMCSVFLLLGPLFPHLWIPPSIHRLFIPCSSWVPAAGYLQCKGFGFPQEARAENGACSYKLVALLMGRADVSWALSALCVCCSADRHWLIKVHETETQQSQGWAGYPAEEVKGDWLSSHCLGFWFCFGCYSSAVLP